MGALLTRTKDLDKQTSEQDYAHYLADQDYGQRLAEQLLAEELKVCRAWDDEWRQRCGDLPDACMDRLKPQRVYGEVLMNALPLDIPRDIWDLIATFTSFDRKSEFIGHIRSIKHLEDQSMEHIKQFVKLAFQKILPVWKVNTRLENREDLLKEFYFELPFQTPVDKEFSKIDEIYWIRYGVAQISGHPTKMHNVVGRFKCGLYFHFRDNRPNTAEGLWTCDKVIAVSCTLEDLVRFGMEHDDRIAIAKNLGSIATNIPVAVMSFSSLKTGEVEYIRQNEIFVQGHW